MREQIGGDRSSLFRNSIKLYGGYVMRKLLLVSAAGCLFLAACNNIKKPSSGNLTRAINLYLAKHGDVCTAIVPQFPVDVPRRKQKEQYGIGPKLATLEQVGLVHSSDTTAVVHGMLDALRGSAPPQPVKRYELTPEGKKYFQELPNPLGQTGAFCYGQKSVDAIVKWTEPGTNSQTEVTYTYKIVNLASWAERPDVQKAFPDIGATVSGASKTNQVVGLQLTNQGWEVPGQ
jgi:hypothetical protein